VLLEHRTAQHALRRQAVAARVLDAVPAQVRRNQAEQRTVLIQPCRYRLELAADLVPREKIEYAGLDPAFLARIVGSGGGRCSLASVA
jgi:predicted Zn-dependent protease